MKKCRTKGALDRHTMTVHANDMSLSSVATDVSSISGSEAYSCVNQEESINSHQYGKTQKIHFGW